MDANTTTRLQRRWEQLLEASRVPHPLGSRAFAEVCRAYQQSHRHYHTLAHLEHMLGLLADSGTTAPEALWATWYHDYVYRPGRSSNEQRSAVIARQALSAMGVADYVAEHTARIILATRSHQCSQPDVILQAVLDADMAILGSEPQQYRDYCDNVRREFSLTPRMLFDRGRRRFIESVLAQPRIFTTEWFGTRFETAARANLRSELQQL